MPVACPKLAFSKIEDQATSRYVAHDPAANQTAGALFIEKRIPNTFYVSYVLVNEGYKRCGIGTRLYEMAARDACAKGIRLQSDRRRSAYSEKFWQKQVNKGRAVCIKPSELTNKDRKEFSMKEFDADAFIGRGGCDRYALVGCPETLQGQRKYRRKRKKPIK